MRRSAARPRISVEDSRECCRLAASGQDAFLDSLVDMAGMIEPNAPMDIVEWARENIVLPYSVSPERPGPLEFSPVQAAIIRKTQHPTLKQVTFKKPPRFGSSLMSVAIILYNAFHEGASRVSDYEIYGMDLLPKPGRNDPRRFASAGGALASSVSKINQGRQQATESLGDGQDVTQLPVVYPTTIRLDMTDITPKAEIVRDLGIFANILVSPRGLIF